MGQCSPIIIQHGIINLAVRFTTIKDIYVCWMDLLVLALLDAKMVTKHFVCFYCLVCYFPLPLSSIGFISCSFCMSSSSLIHDGLKIF